MKWFNEILTAAKSFFGLEHDATEQEVHEKITSMKTFEEMQTGIEASVRARIEQEEGERYGAQIASEAARADAAETRAADLESQLADANTRLTALQASIATLEADATALQARIAELEKLPGATHTAGDTDTGDTGQKTANRPYHNNPIYQKALKMRRG